MPPRKRWMRQPLSWRRGGLVALVILMIVMVAALVLDSGTTAEMEPVVEYVQEAGRPPVQAIVEAGRTARIVLLSDIPGVAAPKRLMAEAVPALAEGPGLDAVVLAVSSDEQPYIEGFLNAGQEDAALLLGRSAAVRETEGAPRAFLDIYSAVYRMNEELGPARRIRIIAVDVPGWPPPEGADPTELARLYAARTEHMLARLEEEVLSRLPDARLLVLVDGYMTLQRTHGEARFAGGGAVRVEWLGEMLRQRNPGQVRTVLIDAPTGIGGLARVPTYHGTVFHSALRREVDGGRAVRTTEVFSAVTDPVLEASSPALRLNILPDSYTLREAADVYAYLQRNR